MKLKPYAALLGALISFGAVAATPKDTLVVAKNIEDIVALDPAQAFEFSSGEMVSNMYEPLVQYDPRDPTKVVPGVAASWKTAADGKSLEFTLRPNAVFASGNAVRAEDVMFSFRRVIKLNKAPAFILAQLGWTNDNIAQMVTKLPNGNVSVAWTGVFGPGYVLNVLAARPGNIVDEKIVMANEQAGDLGNAWLNRNSAGSGPFTLKQFRPKEALLLEANKRAAEPPKLNGVLFRNVTEPATQRLLIEQGDVDIARDLGPDQIAALRTRTDLRVEDFPQAVVHFISLNQKSEKLRNPAVWEAMRYLVDYDSIAKQLLRGQMRVHQAFLPVGFAGALTTTPYKLDPDRAKAILTQAGITNLEIDLDLINTPRFMDMAQSMQATMAKAGIKLNLLPGTGAQVITRYRARQHQAMLLFWGPAFFDPHSNAKAFAYNVDNSDAAFQSTTTWRNSWLVPELSAKAMDALKESNPARRAALYQGLQQEVQAKSPIIVTFQEQNQAAFRSNVKGYIQGSVADLIKYEGVTK
ncbi:MAG: ABC transporter substrate-binding protein [Rhodoferax sp.]|nr:ABC transporter substrate-binding protein [Rhodoferax sp.]